MKLKRFVSGLLATLMVVSMFAGCGKDNKETPSSNQTPETGATVTGTAETDNTKENTQEVNHDKKITIEIVENTEVTADIDDFVAKELLEKFNIEVKTVKLPEYAQQLNIRLSGGNIPDIFLIPNRTLMTEMVKNEYLLELTPYLEQLQPTVDFVSDGSGVMTSGIYNDGVYAIPKREQINKPLLNDGLMIRKDWLEKLNLSMPTNYDELFEVAKAFTEKDPDGNGKKDTYGFFSEWGLQSFGKALMTDLKCDTQNTIYIEDGELKSTLYNENMKEALRRGKIWMDSGVVDPDVIANLGASSSATIQQCKVGIVYASWATGWRTESVRVYEAVDPECEWEWVPLFEGDDYNLNYRNVGGGNLFGINPELPEKDPEKLARIIELFNYVSSEEGQRLVCYGREGVEYTLDGDNIIMTEDPEILKDSGFVWAYQISGRDEEHYLKTKFAYMIDKFDVIMNREAIASYGGLILPPEEINLADMNTYIVEEMWKFLYGNRDIEEYDEFLKELEEVYNYSAYFESAQEQLKEFQILK